VRLGNTRSRHSFALHTLPVRLAAFAFLAVLGACLLACSGGGSASSSQVEDPVVATVPFSAGERLTYELRDDTGVVGRGTLTATRDGDQLLLAQEYLEAAAPEGEQATSDHSTVTVNATTLAPRSVDRVIQGRDDSDRYIGQYAADGSAVVLTQNDSKERTLELPANAYENESSLWLWRTLPFAEDYKSRYVSVNTVERKRQTVELEVTGQQKITVPAGTFDTWRLQVRNGRATRVAWINIEAPHEISGTTATRCSC
jgi:hypothetical protein